MNLGSILYTILIGPLKLLFEVVYTFAYFITGNAGLSIIALSLVMNVLLLPLYKRADEVQEKENQIQKQLKRGVDHIKKAFKGDEQYMVLNTYYRQNSYKPIYALRSSISLLLQIPFFIAAYDFLSNEYTVLSSSFGPIGSLGSPDHLLGGVNLLPIAMTLINIISSIIYTKGQPLKNNIQLYIMALAFLIFLYDRPSGLVFYWTLNNLFSLIKNIFMKMRNAKMIFSVLLSLAGLAMLGLVLFVHPLPTMTMTLGVSAVFLLFQIPLVIRLIKKKQISFLIERSVNNSYFYIEVVFLSLFFGLFVPTRVIGSSPSEFIDTVTMVSPISYILNTLFLAAGTFGVWVTVFYSLMNTSVKRIIQYALFLLCMVSAVDFLFFGRDLGTMNNLLVYDDGMSFTATQNLYNLIAVMAVIVVVLAICRLREQLVRPIMIISIIAMVILSSVSLYRINDDVREAMKEIGRSKHEKASLELSRNGKNVVVLIIDRAINTYFPFIINEKPELLETFSGFTYYPNTVSFGRSTNLGIPAVYGGYEYTPEELDKRDQEYLPEKHNEALKVMPVLFDDKGYDVTVFDPCYANYRNPGDLSVFNDYPDIKRYNTMTGMFDFDRSIVNNDLETLNRNLFCFGITKAAPTLLQPILYNAGAYNSVTQYETMFSETKRANMSLQAYIDHDFARTIAVIQNFIGISKISDDNQGDFLLLYNSCTHMPTLLQEPDYEMKTDIDNSKYDMENNYTRTDAEGNSIHFENYDQISHYHANMKSILEIGKWLDYMKEEGVYDNTRIIIVSDHGWDLGQYDNMIFEYKDGETVDLMLYNPLLLYKDFDSKEFTTDDSFMTNADVPYLAVKDLIEDPVNPFTGKVINDDIKQTGPQHIFMSQNYFIHLNNGKKFEPGKWLYVHDNVFDLNNWYEE